MTLTYGSVCSGIEAVTHAWHPLGMRPKFFAETDEFCSAVLARHYPEIPNLGDFTKIGKDGPKPTVDVLIGGTPCQSFSQSGGRAGLRDPRGNLALEFFLLAARLSARWVVWENVPGVLFSRGADQPEDGDDEDDSAGPTRNTNWLDFGTILGALAELGYGLSYRILDAQHFGVPQRRRRVFVIGHSGGDWRAAAAVLLERESLRGTAPPSRATGTAVARTITARAPDRDPDFTGPGNLVADTLATHHEPARDMGVVAALTTRPYADHGHQGNLIYNVQPAPTSIVRNALVAKATDVAEGLTAVGPQRRSERGDLVVMPLQGNAYCRHAPSSGFGLGEEGDPSYTLKGDNDGAVVVSERVTPLQSAEATNGAQGGTGIGKEGDPGYTLTTRHDSGVFVEQDQEPLSFDPAQVTHPENRSKCEPGQPSTSLTVRGKPHVAYRSVVRRLTPREYERLQGFPDDFTLIEWKGKPAADSRRYKAVGNSMAVPVMRWLGERILMVESILEEIGDARDGG